MIFFSISILIAYDISSIIKNESQKYFTDDVREKALKNKEKKKKKKGKKKEVIYSCTLCK